MVTIGELRPGLALAAGVGDPRRRARRAASRSATRSTGQCPALGLVLPVARRRRPRWAHSGPDDGGLAAAGLNVFFLAPYGTLRVAVWEDVLALGVFVAVAATVGTLSRGIDRAPASVARTTAEIEDLRVEAQIRR